MKKIIFLSVSLLLFTAAVRSQVNRNTPNDGDWDKQYAFLKNTAEADYIIRIGDIDNLGFGWEEGFTPFSGRATQPHTFPWDPGANDAPGTDRIIVPSGYNNNNGFDGYSISTTRPGNFPRRIMLPLKDIKDAVINSATLQLFVDDFQSPEMKSKFLVRVNGFRFIEMEKLLATINESGPIGRIINVKLNEELLGKLKGDSLSVFIDDPKTGSGDGFAIDFVKLLINPKPSPYLGNIKGSVVDAVTNQPIANATVAVKDFASTTSDDKGNYFLKNIPAGLNDVVAGAPGYASNDQNANVVQRETTDGIVIPLSRSGKVTYNNKTLTEGETIVMNNIQFELSSANLTATGKQELDKLAAFMKQNATMEILLTGHTSDDGSAITNKELSVKRVKNCHTYLINKGIDEGRIAVKGFGSEKPIAPNDTEPNRAKNRRVEMEITRI